MTLRAAYDTNGKLVTRWKIQVNVEIEMDGL